MNKYVVKVVHVFANLVEVEAENEEKAREVAVTVLQNPESQDPIDHLYESTFPPEHWAVITKEKYDELKSKVEAGLIPNANDNQPNNIIEPKIFN